MFDVLIVGGGPAGMSAALMLGRCRRRCSSAISGSRATGASHALHGYLTRDGVAPPTFNEMARGELPAYGIEMSARVGVTGAQWETTTSASRSATASEERRASCYCHRRRRRAARHRRLRRVLRPVALSLSVLRRLGMARPAPGGVRQGRHGRRPRAGAEDVEPRRRRSAPTARASARALRERLARNGIEVRTEPIARLEHRTACLPASRSRRAIRCRAT